jgi:HSP20 family molecular chaperone IbpA
MTTSGFDPFSTMDRLLGRTGFCEGATPALGLPADVYRRGDEFIVEGDVPGTDPTSLDVTVERDMLSISGERPALTTTPRRCGANGPTPGSAGSCIWARTSRTKASKPATKTVC